MLNKAIIIYSKDFTKNKNNNMKKYWKQIVGALILVLVLILVNKATNDKHLEKDNDRNKKEIVNPNAMMGEVTAIFEGEHKLNYELVLTNGATTSLSKNNKLLTVKSSSSTSPIYFYFSYEGGRGYSAADYIKNNINPNTNIVKREEMQHGDNTWSVVRSSNSSWHVAGFGEWLVVIENNNLDKDLATKYIESFKVAKNGIAVGDIEDAKESDIKGYPEMKDGQEINKTNTVNIKNDVKSRNQNSGNEMKMISTSTYEMN